jgi:hypothetical protein
MFTHVSLLLRVFMFRLLLLPILLLCAISAHAQSILATVPDSVDTEKHYLFYIHDDIVNSFDMEPEHPVHGVYDYAGVVNRFATEGFTVISYPRMKGTHPYTFADETREEIRKLLAAGVPASHIAIVGAGTGGGIAILITTKLRDPDLQVVLLATCTDPFIAYWKAQNELLSGNVLSIYHPASDRGPCSDFLEYCRSHGVSRYQEIALPEKAKPGFYYLPTTDWMVPAILWASGKHDLVRG